MTDELLAAAQAEVRKHDFYTYVENAPAIAQGGKGVVVPGYPHCKKWLGTIAQFTDTSQWTWFPTSLMMRLG